MANEIKEGDLYKIVEVAGKKFDIRYERLEDPDPEDPDALVPHLFLFEENPEYTKDGFAFRNKFDSVCPYLKPKDHDFYNHECERCVYLSETVEYIGVCRCTGMKLRGAKTPREGREMIIAVVGELPVAEKIILDEYKNVRFDRYDTASNMSFIRAKQSIADDLILIRCELGENLENMELIGAYTNGGETVNTPVRLICEPPSVAAEAELVQLVNKLADELNT